MKISELCEVAGVPRATVKFYLREGVLHPGRASSRTRAEYDQGHVDRIRLVRALTEMAGLRLDDVRQVLAVIDDPQVTRLGVMATAQQAMRPLVAPRAVGEPAVTPGGSRAAAWLAARGWRVGPESPLVDDLERAWAACEEAGAPIPQERLNGYADAVEAIAELDLDSVAEDPRAAVHQVVVGTYLGDPVLACLRRLAQQHVAVTRLGAAQDC